MRCVLVAGAGFVVAGRRAAAVAGRDFASRCWGGAGCAGGEPAVAAIRLRFRSLAPLVARRWGFATGAAAMWVGGGGLIL